MSVSSIERRQSSARVTSEALKIAAEGWLPAANIRRGKQGFLAPLDRWLRRMESDYRLVAHDRYPFTIYDKHERGPHEVDCIEVFKFVPRGEGRVVVTLRADERAAGLERHPGGAARGHVQRVSGGERRRADAVFRGVPAGLIPKGKLDPVP